MPGFTFYDTRISHNPITFPRIVLPTKIIVILVEQLYSNCCLSTLL